MQFLTAPDTRYRERIAAASQGKQVFPITWLVRLVTTLDDLREEQMLHRWGLKPSPMSAGFAVPRRPLLPEERTRHILRHDWVVPDKPTGFEPVSNNLTQMSDAPWPLQVQTALDCLYNEIVPQMHVNNPPVDVAYAEQWYTEAFKLPCNTDRQATLFVQVTTTPMHYKSLRVLARWRQIALNPRFPVAASRVASNLGEAMRLWGDERAQDIGQAILCDILHTNTNSAVLLEAAWTSQQLLERFTPVGDQKLDPPMQVVVALGDLAVDPASGSEWDRLYSFVNPIYRLIQNPPTHEDIDHMAPNSPEVPKLLDAFAAWFREHRAAFVREGQKQIHATTEIATIREAK